MPDDRLDSVLDECIARLRAGATVDECLAAYPSWRADLERLLFAAARVGASAPPDLSDDARMRGWARLTAAMGSARSPAGRLDGGGRSWGRLLLVPALAAAIALGLFFGYGTSRAPDSAEAATILTVLQGDVKVETLVGVVVARSGMQLRPGDRIVTSVGARAVLTFLDGSTVTLDGDTAVLIRSVVDARGQVRVNLNQARGNTWTYLPPNLGPGQIEIDTPTARLQANQASFSTSVDSGGRTQVGAQTGAIDVSSGNQRTNVTGGMRTTVDSAGVVAPASQDQSPPRELVVRIGGPALGFLTDPAGATVGLVAPGVAVNQIAGAAINRGSDGLVLRIPDPRDGAFKLVLHALGGGSVSVSAVGGGNSATADTATLPVAAEDDWGLAVNLQGDRVQLSRPLRLEGAAALPPNVNIPDKVLEKAKATITAGSPQPAGTATKPPPPTSTPSPTTTPTPRTTATPPRVATPATSLPTP